LHHVINNFIKLHDLYGKNRPKGGNKKLTRKQNSLVLHAAAKGNVTAGQIRADLNLPVSKWRV
jgi:hypothetical protein